MTQYSQTDQRRCGQHVRCGFDHPLLYILWTQLMKWITAQKFIIDWNQVSHHIPYDCMYAMHGIAKAFLSVCQMHRLWQNERTFCPHSYAVLKIIYPSFMTRRIIGGATPSTRNFGPNWPCWSENADFQLIFGCSTWAVILSEKSSINTNRKSTTCIPVFLRWTLYVAPKPQRGRFLCKIALHLKKVCYKVSLCEYCQRQSCKAFTGLSPHAKMVHGDVPYYVKIWLKPTKPLQKPWFPINIHTNTNRKSTTSLPMSPR